MDNAVKSTEAPNDKTNLLKNAEKTALFSEHCSNHWITGAFGCTKTVKQIKLDIQQTFHSKKPQEKIKAKKMVEIAHVAGLNFGHNC